MMKNLVLAIGLMAVGAAQAAAQAPPPPFRAPPPPPPPVYQRDAFPYDARRHDVCQRKAYRLREYERYAASDGRISGRERREIESLRYDLDRTCGRFRHRD